MPTADREGLREALRDVVMASLKVGAPGLSDATRQAIARSIVLKTEGRVLPNLLAQADTAAQAVAEQDRLRSVLDFERRAHRVQKGRADRLSAEEEARDKALKEAHDALAPFAQAWDMGMQCSISSAAFHAARTALAAGQDKEGGKP